MAQTLKPDAIKGANGNSPRHAGGRPLRVTVARFLRICALIQEGKCNSAACKIEGVDYSGFRAHVRRKPWWQKRYLHADQVRDEYLKDLYLGIVSHHAKESWQAAAWILERKWPALFALHFTHRDTNATEQPQVYRALTREELLETIRISQAVALEAPKGFAPRLVDLTDEPPVAEAG
jgi:hypothetical protein